MKIKTVTGCPYEDYKGQVLHLHVWLDDGEVIHLGDTISIEMMDDTFLDAEVKLINPEYAGDYAWITKKAAEGVESEEHVISEHRVMKAEGPDTAVLAVLDVPYHEVKTEERSMICVSPFKEILLGSESIYDYVQEGYTVPDKVIAYLRTTKPYFVHLGIYGHPFKSEERLLGPYTSTDGKHYWDRDTWKYVLKYHVTLPQEFIDYVMSDEGDAFLERYNDETDSWSNTIMQLKKRKGTMCYLPDNAGEIELEDF